VACECEIAVSDLHHTEHNVTIIKEEKLGSYPKGRTWIEGASGKVLRRILYPKIKSA
jgi:hypothetical protein